LSPVFDWSIRSYQSAGAFITTHDDLQQFLSCGLGQLAHAQVIDDQQRDGGQPVHHLFAGTFQRSFGKFFQQSMSLTIEHSIPLLDGSRADRLSQMTLSASRWTEKESVFAARSEERRVGKECRWRWWQYDYKKKDRSMQEVVE